MHTSEKKNKHSDVVYYSTTELRDIDDDSSVSSSLLNTVFLPLKRVPVNMLRQMASSYDELEKRLTAQVPLLTGKITKPYWPKQKNRSYDTINVDVYGAVCLADDRDLLDAIIASGGLIQGAENLTLRQLCDHIGLSVHWDSYPDQAEIDKQLLNRDIYFHVKVTDILKLTNKANSPNNRQMILTRLKRLSLMMLLLSFEKNGEVVPNRTMMLNVLDRRYHPILDMNTLRNKNLRSDSTYTDIIINVSEFYVNSLMDDGIISRKRYLNNYRHLTGPNSISDLFKFLDSHKREYIHGKWLSEIIDRYLSEKLSLVNVNVYSKSSALIEQMLDMRPELDRYFNLLLKAADNPNKRMRAQDYLFVYKNIDSKVGT